MRIGVSEQSARKVSDPREGARFMVERAAAARRAGLDSLFVGAHHATPGQYYQNVPITARMLAEWSNAPAGCLFLLPLWNPVLLAEQVGTLAAIAGGRPSLLQDVIRGRRTEIEELNGYVVAEGKRLGVPTPFNEAIVREVNRHGVGTLQPDPKNLEPIAALLSR